MLKINLSYQKIYNIVARIPSGKVATYGQVAELAGLRGQARLVGYALHNLPHNSTLPWHRVINRLGEISYAIDGYQSDNLQRRLLEAEGIIFNDEGRTDLNRFRWCE